MGWPGIDYEELAELLPASTFKDMKQVTNTALAHVRTAKGKLKGLHDRTGYVVVRETIEDLESVEELLRGR